MKLRIFVLFAFYALSGQAQIYNEFKIIEDSIDYKWPEKNIYNIDKWLLGLNPPCKIEQKWDGIPIVIYDAETDSIVFTDGTPPPKKQHSCILTRESFGIACMYYQIIKDNDTILVDYEYKFRQLFCPIENEIEAVSYIYALTEYYPIFNLDFLNTDEYTDENDVSHNWVVYQPEVSTSYVHKTKDGYELLLYWYQYIGCDHPYSSAIFDLKADGSFTIRNKKIAFEDKQNPGICND